MSIMDQKAINDLNKPKPDTMITLDPMKIVLWLGSFLGILTLVSIGIYIYMVSLTYQKSPASGEKPTQTAQIITQTDTPTPTLTLFPITPTKAVLDTVNNLNEIDNIRAVPFTSLPIKDLSNWKTVTSTRMGYTIKIPESFDASQFESVPDASGRDLNTNLTIGTSPNAFSQCADGAVMNINYPVQMAPPHSDFYGQTLENGFQGLIIQNYANVKTFDNFTTQLSQLSVFATQIVTLDEGIDNSPCGKTNTTFYLDMKNNSIVSIMLSYKNTQSQFLPVLYQILSTLRFSLK